MKTYDELRQEAAAKKSEWRLLRTAREEQWRNEYPSFWYRFGHDSITNRSTAGVWVALVIVVAGMLLFTMFATGQFNSDDIGEVKAELEADRSYECPFCQWEGTTGEMNGYSESIAGLNAHDVIIYYCPDCGQVMGHIDMDDRQGGSSA